jgi:hypothetical protein
MDRSAVRVGDADEGEGGGTAAFGAASRSAHGFAFFDRAMPSGGFEVGSPGAKNIAPPPHPATPPATDPRRRGRPPGDQGEHPEDQGEHPEDQGEHPEDLGEHP